MCPKKTEMYLSTKNDYDDYDDYNDYNDEDSAENDAVNLIHPIKQARNVCNPYKTTRNGAAVISTSFSHGILIFTKIT